MQIKHTEIILYVSDQNRSTEFYSKLFQRKPDLNVPGMTEFSLSENCKLGLMPNAGIAKIITPALAHPDKADGIPRCELYFSVPDIHAAFQHALTLGVKVISAPANRDWGDCVCYFADPDNHVIALATKIA